MGYLHSRRFDLYSNYQITSPNLETPMATRPKKYTLETICQEIDKFRPVPCPDEILNSLPPVWFQVETREELLAGYRGYYPDLKSNWEDTKKFVDSLLFSYLYGASIYNDHYFQHYPPGLTELIIKLFVRK